MDAILGMELPLLVKFVVSFAIVLLLIGAAALLVRKFGGKALVRGAAQRGRQPRLAVVDTAKVDSRRSLVIVRRDNVEHLLLIGGPTDVLVESNISGAAIAPVREPEAEVRAPAIEPVAVPRAAVATPTVPHTDDAPVRAEPAAVPEPRLDVRAEPVLMREQRPEAEVRVPPISVFEPTPPAATVRADVLEPDIFAEPRVPQVPFAHPPAIVPPPVTAVPPLPVDATAPPALNEPLARFAQDLDAHRVHINGQIRPPQPTVQPPPTPEAAVAAPPANRTFPRRSKSRGHGAAVGSCAPPPAWRQRHARRAAAAATCTSRERYRVRQTARAAAPDDNCRAANSTPAGCQRGRRLLPSPPLNRKLPRKRQRPTKTSSAKWPACSAASPGVRDRAHERPPCSSCDGGGRSSIDRIGYHRRGSGYQHQFRSWRSSISGDGDIVYPNRCRAVVFCAPIKDQRARQVGEILTVMVNITDKAAIANQTHRSRTSADENNVDNFFGKKTLPIINSTLPTKLFTQDSSTSTDGKGSVKSAGSVADQRGRRCDAGVAERQSRRRGPPGNPGQFRNARTCCGRHRTAGRYLERQHDQLKQDCGSAHRLRRPRSAQRRTATAVRPAVDGCRPAILVSSSSPPLSSPMTNGNRRPLASPRPRPRNFTDNL